MTGFILKENEGVKYYQVSAFSKTNLIKHGFSTRLGGISADVFSSLNLGFHTNDDFHAVLANRFRFAQSLGINPEKIVAGGQVHGDMVYTVDYWDIGKGALDQESVIPHVDALITNKPGIGLITFFADCVPIMFLDPVKKVIAIAHAGWKGTLLRIGAKTARRMSEVYDSRPQNILVAIGPSIGPCHYEVDLPVIKHFQKEFENWAKFMEIKNEDKAQLNLWEANKLQLLEAGVPLENITVARLCTFCHPELFYSYRYNQGKTGRLAGLIMLTGESLPE